MKVRIITSQKCDICKAYTKRLKNSNFVFEEYDLFAPENQESLDEWNIDEAPVVQIIDDQNKVLHQFTKGTWSINAINTEIERISKEKNT